MVFLPVEPEGGGVRKKGANQHQQHQAANNIPPLQPAVAHVFSQRWPSKPPHLVYFCSQLLSFIYLNTAAMLSD